MRAPGKSRVVQAIPLAVAPLSMNVLGGAEIAVDGRPVAVANRKALALLAHLAVSTATSHPRAALAALLWPGAPDTRSRASLRQVLAELRRVLAPIGDGLLTATRQTVALDRARVRLDIDTLASCIRAGTLPEVLFSRARVADTLLLGFDDIGECFERWLEVARDELKSALATALEQGYDGADHPLALRRRMAEAARLLDPLDERACRATMRLAAGAGETEPALRAYAELCRHLDGELGMEPSAATQDLVVRIKQGAVPDTSSLGAVLPEPAATSVGAAPLSVTGEPTVAVLPWRRLGPEPIPEFFAEGVLEDTACRLATLREPVVMSANSTRGLADREVDVRRVGRELGVRYVVAGSIRKIRDCIRLAVELVDVSNGMVVWADRYDTDEIHSFETHDRIANDIARTLVPQLRGAELARMRGTPPDALSVYQLLLQARTLAFRLQQPAFEEAGALIRRALGVDPEHAPVHAAFADWLSTRIGQGWSPRPEHDAAAFEEATRRAIELDPQNGRALALLGHNRTTRLRGYDEALGLFERALESSPNDAETLLWSSPTYAFMGEAQAGVARAKRAMALSPRDPYLFRYEHFLSIAYYAAGEYDEAAKWGMQSALRNDQYTSNLRMTAAALVCVGKRDEARRLSAKVMELQPGFRVAPFIAKQAFSDRRVRDAFGTQLVEAGLPN